MRGHKYAVQASFARRRTCEHPTHSLRARRLDDSAPRARVQRKGPNVCRGGEMSGFRDLLPRFRPSAERQQQPGILYCGEGRGSGTATSVSCRRYEFTARDLLDRARGGRLRGRLKSAPTAGVSARAADFRPLLHLSAACAACLGWLLTELDRRHCVRVLARCRR